jgi:hypothetical protein
VTSVGEYLLTLPQQLEPLAEGISGNEAGNDEAQFFATEWIFKVMNADLQGNLFAYKYKNGKAPSLPVTG